MIGMHSKRRLRDAKRQRGVTLVEMMVALGIMAFGILTMALMQLAALKQGTQGQHTTDAAAVGRTYLEQVHRLPWSELTTAVAAGDWTNPSWLGANSSVTLALDTPTTSSAAPGQTYAVAWRVTDVAGNTCLRDVEIRITWNEEDFAAPRTITLSTRRYNWGGSSC
jgi:prepilin-type N-terminal cleavage/methylation domain-containing protein